MATNTEFLARATAALAGTALGSYAVSLAAKAPTAAELIAEAGRLNNHPALVGVDHVSFMGFMTRDEMERHVEKLRSYVAA